MVSSLWSEGLPSVYKSQALAGPRFYYSDLRFGVGRCFFVYILSIVTKVGSQSEKIGGTAKSCLKYLYLATSILTRFISLSANG